MMPRYKVEWKERTERWALVDAATEEEAVEKAKCGEVVEGSQDSDPGKMDKRTVRVDRRIDGEAG